MEPDRCLKAVVASIVLLLSSAGTAFATPMVSVGNQTANFTDQNGTTADLLVVEAPVPSTSPIPGALDYEFKNNVAMSFGPGCLPKDPGTNRDVVCTVPSGRGVVVDLGGAPGSAAQSAQLKGSWIVGTAPQVSSLTGGPGADTLIGASGTDTLSGAGGPDDLDGGPGADTADYADAGQAVTAQIDDQPDSGAGCPGAGCEGDRIEHSIENL